MAGYNFVNNQYYEIINKKSGKVADVNNGSQSDGANIFQWTPQQSDNQKFLFFALDGGMYAIAAKHSGRVWGVTNRSTSDGASIIQWEWDGDKNQEWYTNNGSSDYYEITNKNSGKVVAVSGGSTSNGADIIQWFRNNEDDQKWSFKAVETIELPDVLNTQPLPDIPHYTSSASEILPVQTVPVITATALLPCIMVADNRWDHRAKMQSSPYYNFVKEQYWERVESFTFPPGYSKTFQYTTGMKITDQDSMARTTSMSIGADAGFQFKNKTASISTNFTTSLEVTKSHTTEQMTEQIVTETYTNPLQTTVGWTKYILVNKYHLLRTDGSQVDIAWKVTDPNTTRITTYPAPDILKSFPVLCNWESNSNKNCC